MLKETIVLPDDLTQEVAVKAEQAGISRSQFVREAIAARIATLIESDPELAKIVADSAASSSAKTEEQPR
jgi:hypothetical protein